MSGEAMDIFVEQKVDGIVIWSVEGSGQLQSWNEIVVGFALFAFALVLTGILSNPEN